MSTVAKTLAFALSAALSGFAAMPAEAANVTLGVQYFTIAGTYNTGQQGDPDFNTIGCCTQTFTDEVQSTVGALGLPVYNPNSAAPLIHDTLPDGEITWWSPALNPNVTYTGSGTVTTPYANYSFFPPNGTGSNDGPSSNFQGAIFSGQFILGAPEQVTFSFGADDDAFLVLDGQVIAQEGGIHGVSPAPVTSSTLGVGQHNFQLFYVDRNVVGAGLYFNIDTTDIDVTPPTGVPEPASLALVAAGALAALRRRRR